MSFFYVNVLDDQPRPWEEKGCWADDVKKRTMVNIDHKIPKRFGANYQTRRNPVGNCMRAAIERGYVSFALQDGGQCFGSPNIFSYKKLGRSFKCVKPYGGPSANNVFEINHRKH